jgi:hypothetical protein
MFSAVAFLAEAPNSDPVAPNMKNGPTPDSRKEAKEAKALRWHRTGRSQTAATANFETKNPKPGTAKGGGSNLIKVNLS